MDQTCLGWSGASGRRCAPCIRTDVGLSQCGTWLPAPPSRVPGEHDLPMTSADHRQAPADGRRRVPCGRIRPDDGAGRAVNPPRPRAAGERRTIRARSSRTAPVGGAISRTPSAPGAACRASWPAACGAGTRPRRWRASWPGTSRSTGSGDGSRRSWEPGSAVAPCDACDGAAWPGPPARFGSPPSPAISNAA